MNDRKKAKEQLVGEDIFQAIPHPTLILNPECNVIAANRAAVSSIGKSADEILGMKCYEIYHGTDRPPKDCPFNKMLSTGHLETVEQKTEALGGTFIVSITPIFDKTGNLEKVIHIATDITERSQQEEQLRLLSTAMEQSTEGIAVADLEGNLNFVNNTFSAMHGYDSKELVGKHLSIFHTPEQMPSVDAANRQIRETGEFKGEIWHVRRDGTVFPTLMQNSLIRDDTTGKVKGVVEFVRDITGRKRVEAIREESEEKFSKAFRTSLDSIAITSIDGRRFIDVNDTFLDIFGYRREEVIGKASNELNIWNPYEQRDRIVQELKEKGVCKDVEVKFRKRSGDNILGLFSATIMNLPDGPVMLSMMKDITGRKRAEDFLRIQRDLSIALGVSRDLTQLLEQLLNAAFKVEGIDAGGVYLRNIETGELDLIAHRGLPEQFIKVASHYTADAPQAQLVVKGEPIHAHYNKLGVTFDENHKKETMKAISVIPIKHEKIVIGALNLASHTHDEFPITTRDTIEALAGMIGGALIRVRTEDELRKSEERYRILFNKGNDGILVHELTNEGILGKFTEVNDNICQMLGYTREELLRMSPIDLSLRKKLSKIDALIEKLFNEGHAIFERNFLTSNGRVIPVELSSHFFDFKGKPTVLSIARDLTERKKAETKLLEEKESAQKYLDIAGVLIVVLNIRGEVTLINKKGCEILGYAGQELIGKNWFDVCLPENLKQDVKNVFNELIAGRIEHVEHYENPVITKDGIEQIIAWHNTILKDKEGRIIGTLSSGEDITERKETEEKAKLQQAQLIQADKMASLGILVSGVGHEINNPNNYILPNSRIISRAWEDIAPALERYYTQHGDFTVAGLPYSEAYDEIQKMIQGINKGAERIRTIVQGLREYAHPTVGDIKEKVDVNRVAKAAILLTENLINKSTVNFTKQLKENIPYVKGNIQQLEQVIVNLITNACHALESDEKSIVLSTDYNADNNKVILKVADEGSGISKEDLKKILDPFFTTKRDKGGTGLGLPISSNIVQSHGGDLYFESKEGTGTTATVTLPEMEPVAE